MAMFDKHLEIPTLRKLFKLPTPVDLGWSDYNALGLRAYAQEDQKTWEDWEEHVKKLHPVKFFLAETVPNFFKYKVYYPIYRPVDRAWYKFVSHVVPSRRYHMLDLRQPKGSSVDSYRWGYLEPDRTMLFAMFKCLRDYIEGNQPYEITDEDLRRDPSLKAQKEQLDEAKALYEWWTKERKLAHATIDVVQNAWWEAKQSKAPNAEDLWAQLRTLDDAFDAKEDEMCLRLVRIRRTLWT